MHNRTTDRKLISLKSSTLSTAHAQRKEEIPFQLLVDDWLLACKSNSLSPKTILDYRDKVNKFQWWWKTHTRYAETIGPHPRFVEVKHVREYLVYLQTPTAFRWGDSSTRGRVILSPASIACYGRATKVFFNWLVQEGEIVSAPFNRSVNFAVRKRDEPLIKVIEEENLHKLFGYLADPERLQFFDGKRDLAIAAFLLDTGVRKGELLGMMESDLELARNRCHVNGKTGKRWVYFDDKCRDVLTAYQDAKRALEFDLPQHFWITVEIKPLSYHGLSSIVARIRKNSGVSFHAHQLRHTYATMLTNQGIGIADLARLMGHSQISTTMKYIHQNRERMGEVYKPKSPLRTLKDLPLKTKTGRPRRGEERP